MMRARIVHIAIYLPLQVMTWNITPYSTKPVHFCVKRTFAL